MEKNILNALNNFTLRFVDNKQEVKFQQASYRQVENHIFS